MEKVIIRLLELDTGEYLSPNFHENKGIWVRVL